MDIFRQGVLSVLVMIACFVGSASAAPSPFGEGHAVTVGMDSSSKYYDFKSAISGRVYRIFVAIPDIAPPKEGFPVIYILDGNQFFGAATDNFGMRQFAHEVTPAIIVGVDHPTRSIKEMLASRVNDLTTPISVDRLKMLKRLNPALYAPNAYSFDINGGMDDFLRVIEKEIKPEVAKLAPVNAQRQVLFGHSLGGLTVLHALFTEPSAFQTFIASSPSIWWNDESVLADEPRFSREVAAGRAQPRILIDVGGLEQPPTAPRNTQMITNVVSLGKRLAKLKGGPSYHVETVVFSNETHLSVMPAAISRALGFALGAQ